MFYAHFVLAKKGPLAKIWLAAHWDKKLTKAHVFETNIEKSVDGILKPKVKMALRTSGHLLLGVVRIYSRKAKYLLADCNEAFVKIKMAFRPGMVDLPEEHREAAMNAITLPEVFHDFDSAMPELNEVDIEAQFSLNQSRAEEITMREDYGSLHLVAHDDGFGDIGFDTDHPDVMRDAHAGLQQSHLLFTEGPSMEMSTGKDVVEDRSRHMEPEPEHMEDGFGGTIGDHFPHAGGLFEGELFGEAPGPTSAPPPLTEELSTARATSPADDDEMDFDQGPPSPAHSWEGSQPAEPRIQEPIIDELPLPDRPWTEGVGGPQPGPSHEEDHAQMEQEHAEQTTLLQNEEESFALAPVDATVLKGVTKAKRKRKLIVDEVKNISGEEMKNQLSDTSDVVSTLDLAPPTRRLMHWKETGGVEKLFMLPAAAIPSQVLFKKYQRNMVMRVEGELEAAAAEAEPEQPRRSTRKRKLPAAEIEATAELEPPSVMPAYDPSVDMSPMTPGGMLQSPATPGGLLAPPTPGLLAPATPSGVSGMLDPHAQAPMLQAPQTPAGLHHGGMTPAHGGMTPAHGGMTPAHGGMTPAYGGHDLGYGGMTPSYAAGLAHEDIMPHLPSDQVSSLLGGGLDNIEPLALNEPSTPFHEPSNSLQMANLGYDDQHPASPVRDDYDLPPSVENNETREREEGETEEQFEERLLNRRAAQLFRAIKPKLLQNPSLTFSQIAPTHNKRKQGAQKFYSLLVLKKFQVLELEQKCSYGEVIITRGQCFETEAM